MKKPYRKSILLALVAILLTSGCTRTTTTEKLAVNANKTISQIQADLPEVCKTELINEKFSHAQAEVDTIVGSCKTEKQVIEEQRDKWMLAFFMTIVAIAVYVFMKLRSKL